MEISRLSPGWYMTSMLSVVNLAAIEQERDLSVHMAVIRGEKMTKIYMICTYIHYH